MNDWEILFLERFFFSFSFCIIKAAVTVNSFVCYSLSMFLHFVVHTHARTHRSVEKCRYAWRICFQIEQKAAEVVCHAEQYIQVHNFFLYTTTTTTTRQTRIANRIMKKLLRHERENLFWWCRNALSHLFSYFSSFSVLSPNWSHGMEAWSDPFSSLTLSISGLFIGMLAAIKFIHLFFWCFCLPPQNPIPSSFVIHRLWVA